MILQQKYRSVNNFSEKIHRLFMKFLCNLSTFSLSVLLNFMPAALSFEQYTKKDLPKREVFGFLSDFQPSFCVNWRLPIASERSFSLPKAIFCGNPSLFRRFFFSDRL